MHEFSRRRIAAWAELEDSLLLSCCFLLFSYLLLLLLLFTSLFFYFSFSHDHEFPGDLVEHARSAKVRKRNTWNCLPPLSFYSLQIWNIKELCVFFFRKNQRIDKYRESLTTFWRIKWGYSKLTPMIICSQVYVSLYIVFQIRPVMQLWSILNMKWEYVVHWCAIYVGTYILFPLKIFNSKYILTFAVIYIYSYSYAIFNSGRIWISPEYQG